MLFIELNVSLFSERIIIKYPQMIAFFLILIFGLLPIIIGIYQLIQFVQYLNSWSNIKPNLKIYFLVYGILITFLILYSFIQYYCKVQFSYFLILIPSGFILGIYFFFLSDAQQDYDNQTNK
ncbi:hypothetical protein DCS32_09300 [Dokdonia sp. Dokd-P16]|nr:hypothetical protein DCS32_09300 [Dokdonia sp. Dokd-P16]